MFEFAPLGLVRGVDEVEAIGLMSRVEPDALDRMDAACAV